MILEIDTNYLIENKFTAHQYIILKLVKDNKLSLLEKYLRSTNTYFSMRVDLEYLLETGFVSRIPSGQGTFLTDIVVSDKFTQSMSFTQDPFDVFYNTYPVKVLRPDGQYDYLRVDQKRSKTLYHNLIRENPTIHREVIRCLRMEIKDRASRGKMSFMQRMPKWLTSESWKVYSDITEDSYATIQEERNIRYGETIE